MKDDHVEDDREKPTIEVERRRPGSRPRSARRERAKAPARKRQERSTGGSTGGSLFGGGGSTGVPSLPNLGNLFRSPRAMLVLVVVVICVLGLFLLLGGPSLLSEIFGSTALNLPGEPGLVDDSGPVPTRRPTLPPVSPGAGQTWTVMLYQDADDQILEQDILVDVNEAERVGSGPNLSIVAQIDRYQTGFAGDGNWVGARRYYVRQDDDLDYLSSDLVMDLGEVNMASGATLVDFATWAIENYPADRYVLILSDHGMGWPGGWSDATAGRSRGQVPLQAAMGDHLYLDELDQALEEIRAQTGMGQFEMIGMDACLMGHIEVMSALAPHARYAVFSQETEPALGWAYTSFLRDLRNNPGLTGAQLGEAIVDSYVVDDQRIVDDAARADLVGRGQPLWSLFGAADVPSAAQVAQQMGQSTTLSAVDLQALPELLRRLDELAVALQGTDQRSVAQARSYAQSFTSVFGRNLPPAYIDLGNFAQLVARSSGQPAVTAASASLEAALERVVIVEKHGARLPGATGVSIYFPNSQLYSSPEAGPESYTGIAARFAAESLWDDFLAFHYTGESFDAQHGTVAIPLASTPRRSPASGGIEVYGLSASATEVAPGEQIRLTVEIEGENIGYVRLLVGYLDENANSIYLADSDYLASPDTREVGGVYYPDWGVDSFVMAFNWEPIVYAIDDGTTRYPTLFWPESYGASSEQAVYTVEGIYTYADSGDQRNARLYFANGMLQQVFGFAGEGTASAPREIVPQPGDTFTILETWLDLDSQGQVVQTAQQAGQTLTFGDRMFTWEVLDAAAGQYVVGFIVEDLDGNRQVVFQPITVR